METKSIGLKKRQQIASANRMMFLWVTGVSVIVGFALVLSIFLGQKILFGEKVLAEKSKTVKTLDANRKIIADLQNNIRVLDTNQGLKDTRLKDEDRPIQSVLDALPADANSTALGSSLQSKLLSGISGLTIDTIKVDPVIGVETEDSSTQNVVDASATGVSSSNNTIHFSVTVSTASTNPDALREVLRRLERSIRAIDVRALSVTSQSSRLVMTLSANAYYEPAKTIKLEDKVVRP